jgi:hypothetical protein
VGGEAYIKRSLPRWAASFRAPSRTTPPRVEVVRSCARYGTFHLKRQHRPRLPRATLTPISVNKKVYKPTVSEIKDMYFKLYRGKGAEASVASEAAGSCTSPKGSSSGAKPSTH